MMAWINAIWEEPKDDNIVLTVVSGRFKNIRFDNAIELAIYDNLEHEWILEAYPEAEDISVKYWMPLPKLPKECEL